MHSERASMMAEDVDAGKASMTEYLEVTFAVMVEVHSDKLPSIETAPLVKAIDETVDAFEELIETVFAGNGVSARKKVVYHGGDFSPRNVQHITSRNWEATLRLLSKRGGRDKIQVFAN